MNDIPREEVRALLLSIRDNEHHEPWAKLYCLLRPFAMAVTRRHVSDIYAIEDVVQESFLRLKRVSSRYKAEADGLSFFRGVLRNVIREHEARLRRSRTVRRWSEEGGVEGTFPGDKAKRPREDSDGDWRDALATAMRKLSPSLTEAVRLRVFGAMDCEQAARCAGCSVVAMRKRMSRAMERLRSEIAL
jgi:RNA polymerase sigma-70 factor (ECF subfamily)